ncbi:MAG: hypothetical protein ACTHMS_01160 [Jatrophihabitans sp.]|uniref:hypothetical protein n=1 Tax=Jatrophihabitans sp. TaxID=1932789 RepID=UPI003F7F7F56
MTSGGHFLDAGRRRGGGGPRGVLIADDETLRWLPEHAESKRGDHPHVWPLTEVRCLGVGSRRDISGVAIGTYVLSLPEGTVTLSSFHPVGDVPEVLHPRR